MGAWEDGFAAGFEHGLKSSGAGPTVRARRTVVPRSPRANKKRSGRKPTAYNRFMKREMKSLRRKHPRMKQPQIMKKAAAAWRRKKRR